MDEANLLKFFAKDIKACFLTDKTKGRRRLKFVVDNILKWQNRADKIMELIKKNEREGNKIKVFILKIALKIVLLVARIFVRMSAIMFDAFNWSPRILDTSEIKSTRILDELRKNIKELRATEIKSGIKEFAQDPILNRAIKSIDNLKHKLLTTGIPDTSLSRSFLWDLDKARSGLVYQDLTLRNLKNKEQFNAFRKRAIILSSLLDELASKMEQTKNRLLINRDPLGELLKDYNVIYSRERI